MDINEKVEKAVESYRKEALALLQSLIEIPSMPGNEKPCQDIIIEKLKGAGLELDIFDPPDDELKKHPGYAPVDISYKGRPNVIGIYRGSGDGKSLILNGHVDVVLGGLESDWTYSPWSGKYVDGKVYGRGSCDMKGGVVSNIIAALALRSLDIKLKGDLIIESVVDEESGGNGTLACVMKGYKADGCIFTEPNGFGIKDKIKDTMYLAVGNRGAQTYKITVEGIEGGTDYKQELVNPIEKAMEVFQSAECYSIMRESTASHPLYDLFYSTKVPLAITIIRGGEFHGTISSECCMEGTIECLPNEDIKKVRSDFKNYIDKLSYKDPWFKDHPVKVEWLGLWFESSEITPDHPLVTGIAEKVKIFNKKPLIYGAGGCDLRIPIKYGNTPAIVFGPTGGMIHSIDEYVDFEEVLMVAKTLAAFTLEWCGLNNAQKAN